MLHLLYLDVQPYVKSGKGKARKALSNAGLRACVKSWLDFNDNRTGSEELKMKRALVRDSKDKPYPVLWNVFKRTVLGECGLYVSPSPAHRIFLGESRPQPQAREEEGLWREKVLAPPPWGPEAEDAEIAEERRRQ